MANRKSPIKEQLYSEMMFIRYCNDSNDNRVSQYGKIHVRIEPDFLRAAEADGYLQPLLIIEEPVRQQDGSTKEEAVRYYSPFQIYIVAQLSHNVIEDGKLQSPDTDREWQKQQKCRFVSWGYGGGMSSNSEHPSFRKGVDANGMVNQYGVCEYLHNFLRLLHGFELPPRYSEITIQERERYMTDAPKLQHDLSTLKENGREILAAYDLDAKKLEILRGNIGHAALAIDPLEKWYPFIQRMSQWRRDELKGEAALAQDLYGLCELIADVSEVISSHRPDPLPIALRSDFLSPTEKRNEYAHGTDVEAIKLAIARAREWILNSSNAQLVREVVGQEAPEKCVARLKKLDEHLDDFKKRYSKYGAGRYVNNGGFLYFGQQDHKPIPLKELDEETKNVALQMLDQRREHGRLKNEEQELQSEVRSAIRWRLDDIQRAFADLMYEMIRPMDDRKWKLESERDNNVHTLRWQEEFEATEPPEDKVQRHVKFWREFIPAKRAELDKTIEPYREASKQLGSFASLSRFVLCANCRKNTVLMHQAHNDKKVSSEAICDSCMGGSEPQKIKGGEWNCEECGRKIYTFAHANVLSDVLFNSSNATIQLEYGQISIRARCPNKDCKRWNERTVDWGWLF